MKSPFDRKPDSDFGGQTYGRYRYQAHVAFQFCLDCALGGEVRRVASEHFSDLLVECNSGYRFIEIKTSDEGSWTIRRLLKSGAIDQLWKSFCANDNLDATFEAFLEGPASPKDILAEATCLPFPSAFASACTLHLKTMDSTAGLDVIARFISRLKIRLDLPTRQSIWNVNLALIARQLPELSGTEAMKIHEQIMRIVDKAMDDNESSFKWQESMSWSQRTIESSAQQDARIVGAIELLPDLSQYKRLASSKVTHEELRSFFAKLRTLALDQCVTFRPTSLPVNEIEDFCIPVQLVAERSLEKLNERRALERAQIGEEADYLLPTHESFQFDGVHRITREPMNHALTLDGDIVVRGVPGEGKTTGLWLYAASRYSLIESQLAIGKGEDFRVPLVLSLREVPQENEFAPPLSDLIIESTLQRIPSPIGRRQALQDELKRRLEDGKVELCLDALDELAPGREEWLRNELTRVRQSRVILTTRPGADDRILNLRAPQRYEVVPFGRNQSEQFIRRFMSWSVNGSAIAADLIRRMDDSATLRALMQVPLLLAIACEAMASSESRSIKLPTTRGGFLELGIRRMMQREDQRKHRGRSRTREREKEDALVGIGWRFMERRPLPLLEDSALEVIQGIIIHRNGNGGLSQSSAQEIWDELIQDGLFTRHWEGRYGFILRSFHEVSASKEIASQIASMNEDELIRFIGVDKLGRVELKDLNLLNAPGWQEVWPLIAGELKNALPFLEVLERIRLSSDDLLASRAVILAHALGEAELQLGSSSRIHELATICCKALMDKLLSGFIFDRERLWLCRALGALPGMLGQTALLETLLDDNREIEAKELAIEGLGWIGSDEARVELLKIAKVNDLALERLRGQAVIALGRLGGQEATETIQQIWKEVVPQRVRMACMVTLADLADPVSLGLLVDLMKDDGAHWDLRIYALLETISRGLMVGLEWARQQLNNVPVSQIGDDHRWRLVEACASALGELRDLVAIPPLGNLARSNSTPEPVWRECIESLGEIGTTDARNELLRVQMRGARGIAAACALGHLGEPAVIDFLSKELVNKSRSSSNRMAVAQALAGIDSPQAEATLLSCLSTVDERNADLAGSVLRVLRRRPCSRKDSIKRQALARNLLGSSVPSLRVEASQYLITQIDRDQRDSEAIVETLCESINNSKLGNAIRCRALDALSLFDSPGARHQIAKAAQAVDLWLRRAAISSAATHLRLFGWRLLSDYTWSSPVQSLQPAAE